MMDRGQACFWGRPPTCRPNRRRAGLAPSRSPELSVAIVEAGAAKYGLVVDRFLTEVEVLAKPLTNGLEQCKEFQGAAIMGDGRVVLVLNALECHNLITCIGPMAARLRLASAPKG